LVKLSAAALERREAENVMEEIRAGESLRT
jgi:hypothetical protein